MITELKNPAVSTTYKHFHKIHSLAQEFSLPFDSLSYRIILDQKLFTMPALGPVLSKGF